MLDAQPAEISMLAATENQHIMLSALLTVLLQDDADFFEQVKQA